MSAPSSPLPPPPPAGPPVTWLCVGDKRAKLETLLTQEAALDVAAALLRERFMDGRITFVSGTFESAVLAKRDDDGTAFFADITDDELDSIARANVAPAGRSKWWLNAGPENAATAQLLFGERAERFARVQAAAERDRGMDRLG